MFGLKNTILRFALGLLVIAAINGHSFGETGTASRVLFIGNSYTYYNSMPQLFKAMAENRFPDIRVETKFIGGGGATLKKHWQIGQALEEIKTGRWDYVVLQEQSMLGSKNPAAPKNWRQFHKYARMFDREIKKSGAETVFFMTWSRKDARQQQQYLTAAYMNIAKELNSKIAPVGLVWDRVRENEHIELYAAGGSHPSVKGSFLAAMTLFATIFDVQPQGTPGSLDGYEILRGGTLAKEKNNLCDLSEATVRVIEDAVRQQYRE